MLKQRIITAAILAAIVLAVLLYFPLYGFALVFGVFAFGSFWEWCRLSGVKSDVARNVYLLITAAAGILIYAVIASGMHQLMTVILVAAICWWVYVAIVELAINKDQDRGLLRKPAMKLLAGVMIILPGWASAVYLQSMATSVEFGVLYLLLLVGLSDTAAFFTGRAFGRHKLASKISPGKTIEGLVGGLFAVVVLAFVFGIYVWSLQSQAIYVLVTISVITALFGVAGDLTESRFKRIAGVKDSGSLFPGHGGFLDRTDAFYAAAPVFTFAILYMEQ